MSPNILEKYLFDKTGENWTPVIWTNSNEYYYTTITDESFNNLLNEIGLTYEVSTVNNIRIYVKDSDIISHMRNNTIDKILNNE